MFTWVRNNVVGCFENDNLMVAIENLNSKYFRWLLDVLRNIDKIAWLLIDNIVFRL